MRRSEAEFSEAMSMGMSAADVMVAATCLSFTLRVCDVSDPETLAVETLVFRRWVPKRKRDV